MTEVDVRAMLERATDFDRNVVEGRFMIHVRHLQKPWIVIVEPDVDAELLIVVTVYEVSNDRAVATSHLQKRPDVCSLLASIPHDWGEEREDGSVA